MALAATATVATAGSVVMPERPVMVETVPMAIARVPTVARVVLVAIPGWRGLAAQVVPPALVASVVSQVPTVLLVLT